MVLVGFVFRLQDGRHLKAHAPAMWYGYLTVHVLTEVSIILEGSLGPDRWSSVSRWDVSTKEKKYKQRKYLMKKQGIGFKVKI